MINEDAIKQRVQTWIVWMSITLLGGKFVAFHLTNSVGILTDAMESIVNVVAGIISLYSLKMAAKPRDERHPFGHGKIELISASIEGILIIGAGGIIIYEGVIRLFSPSVVEKLDIGIVVIAVAGIINYAAGWYSIRIGKRYDSMALVAGGKHLQSDTYSTIGLVVGLILLYITGLAWIDSALALIFGSIIVVTGVSILRKTVANLLDSSDTALLEAMLKVVSDNRQPDWVDIHNMKIIKYGSLYHIDCDLTLPWFYNISEGHDACDKLKHTITTKFSNRVIMLIHSDSCKEKLCQSCIMTECEHRKSPLIAPFQFTLEELTKSDDESTEDIYQN